MSRIIISDTSCLIALDRINQLEILQQVFSTISTTPEVQSEFGKPLPSWIQIHNAKNTDRQKELEQLVDKGEASTIALALEQFDSILIIDEKKGRKLAKEFGLEIIGTLKVLLLAKQKGVVTSVLPLIKSLEQNNFRFDKMLVESVLKEAGEK